MNSIMNFYCQKNMLTGISEDMTTLEGSCRQVKGNTCNSVISSNTGVFNIDAQKLQ